MISGDNYLDRKLAYYPRTDLGNAERFRDRNAGKLAWRSGEGWVWHNGDRWVRHDAQRRVTIAAHETVRKIQDEATAIAGTPEDRITGATERSLSTELRAWGRRSEAFRRMASIAVLARPYLSVRDDHVGAVASEIVVPSAVPSPAAPDRRAGRNHHCRTVGRA